MAGTWFLQRSINCLSYLELNLLLLPNIPIVPGIKNLNVLMLVEAYCEVGVGYFQPKRLKLGL